MVGRPARCLDATTASRHPAELSDAPSAPPGNSPGTLDATCACGRHNQQQRSTAALRVAAATLAVGIAAAADDTTPILRPQAVADLGWDERLAGLNDGSIMGGYSRHVLRVAPGDWSRSALRLRIAGTTDDPLLPGDAPWYDGGQLVWDGDGGAAFGPVFIVGQPLVAWAIDDADRELPAPAGDAMAGATELDRLAWTLRVTAGAAGLGHVVAVSTQPWQWGEGVFGSPTVGRAASAPPHLVLAPQRAWSLGDLDWEPVLLRYELIAGLADDRPGYDDPLLAGGRASLRWRDWTLSWTSLWLGAAEVADGVAPEADSATHAVGLGWNVAGSLELRGEYGWDAYGSPVERDDAAWTATIDWLDLTGKQRWRTALEAAENHAGLGRRARAMGGWTEDDLPLDHADGPGARSLRWLLQYRSRREHQLTLIAAARERRLPSAPAVDPWQSLRLGLHVRWPHDDFGSLLVEAVGGAERGRDFDGDRDWDPIWGGGLGWELAW